MRRASTPTWLAGILLVLLSTFLPVLAMAQAGAPILGSGQDLQRDQQHRSPSGRHFLVFQGDGNLVVARTADQGFVWGLNTVPGVEFWHASRVHLEANGFLYARAGNNAILWQVPQSGAKPGSTLHLNEVGELQLIAPDGSIAWTSAKTIVEKLLSSIGNGDALERDVRYVSASGQHVLVFLGDGNLVVARRADDGYVWGSNQVLPDFNTITTVRFSDGVLQLINADINKGKRAGDYAEKPVRWWTPDFDADKRAGARLHITPDGVLQIVTGQHVNVSINGDAGAAPANAAAPAPAATPASAPAHAGLTEEQRSILDRHNSLRAQHGVPALAWSAKLTAEAQAFANACNQSHGTFESRGGAGENLAAYNHEAMVERVQSWYDEEQQYDYNNPGFNKRGNSQETQTGHFTQVVWAATTELGCARADCPGYPWKGFLVCRYLPAGNMADPPSQGGEASGFRRNVPPKR